jgi:hypothetical protein
LSIVPKNEKKTGSAHLVIEFEDTWPKHEGTIIFDGSHRGERITLVCGPSGTIRIRVSGKDGTLIQHQSQPIRIVGNGMLSIYLGWENNAVELYLNNELVPSRITLARPFEVRLKPREISSDLSYEKPEAVDACKSWTEWRRNRYQIPHVPQTVRKREKSGEEQLYEFSNAIKALSNHLAEFSKGKLFLIGDIATALRALVYWEESKSKYNPLLLRIAGRSEPSLPLPVFAFVRDVRTEPEALKKAVYSSRDSYISVRQEFPNQKLIDLQEALLSPKIQSIEDLSSGEANATRELPWLHFIREYASTSAPAHYHEYVDADLDTMQSFYMGGQPRTYQLLFKLGTAVRDLGLFILDQARA